MFIQEITVEDTPVSIVGEIQVLEFVLLIENSYFQVSLR